MNSPSDSFVAPREFALGETLPEAVARRWLQACGEGARIFRGCRIVRPERVRIGRHVQIDEGVRLFGGNGVTLGDYVHLAFGSSISGGGECAVGEFASIGAGARIITGSEGIDGDGLSNPTVPTELRDVTRGAVRIGAHALVFTNVVVFPGVTIGEGAVVSAASVVHRDLKPWSIYCGAPLVQIGVRRREEVLTKARQLTPRREASE